MLEDKLAVDSVKREGYLRSHTWLLLVLALVVTAGIIIFITSVPNSTDKMKNIATATSQYVFDVPNPIAPQPQASPNLYLKNAVPILMYHYIRDYANPNDPLGVGLSVSPVVFKAQLDQLKQAGYQTLSLTNFIARNIQPKSVILTFDDGYDNHYTAVLPILKEEGMTGTFFIIHDLIGQPGYMTANQIANLKNQGMELGDHTLDHLDLATLSYAKAYQQIEGANTADLSPVFAYPSGEYNQQTIDILQSVGEKAAVTTKLGIATDLTDPYQLPRIRVQQNTNVVSAIQKQMLLIHPEFTQAIP